MGSAGDAGGVPVVSEVFFFFFLVNEAASVYCTGI